MAFVILSCQRARAFPAFNTSWDSSKLELDGMQFPSLATAGDAARELAVQKQERAFFVAELQATVTVPVVTAESLQVVML